MGTAEMKHHFILQKAGDELIEIESIISLTRRP